MLWAYFSAGGPGLQIGIVDSIKYQQIKNQIFQIFCLDLPSGL